LTDEIKGQVGSARGADRAEGLLIVRVADAWRQGRLAPLPKADSIDLREQFGERGCCKA
jgi:hypothetical protein